MPSIPRSSTAPSTSARSRCCSARGVAPQEMASWASVRCACDGGIWDEGSRIARRTRLRWR
eukprot:scaffold51702_cov42-Phaeocystis_antarctica.AAC.1